MSEELFLFGKNYRYTIVIPIAITNMASNAKSMTHHTAQRDEKVLKRR
jgi:hypothetical protein